jgi:alpha-N-arabinofuranosidase
MGEYAAQSVAVLSTNNQNNLETALAEAAYLTGLERNADVVRMASYAPLFAHIDGWQWKPDLIWTDNLRVFGTPNYYVQQLFCLNRGDVVLPVILTSSQNRRLYASATRDEKAGEVILKVVNAEDAAVPMEVELSGAGKVSGEARVLVLAGDSLSDVNSFTEPRKLSPKASSLKVGTAKFAYSFPARSLTVLRLKAR